MFRVAKRVASNVVLIMVVRWVGAKLVERQGLVPRPLKDD